MVAIEHGGGSGSSRLSKDGSGMIKLAPLGKYNT
jgi:hypothetical protein